MDERRERLAEARLYLIGDEPTDALLHGALRGGVDIVQLRMKQASEERILAAAARVAAACREHDALFVLNDRPDLAVRAGADGVHVGQADVAVAAARELVGRERIIGLSTHSPAQIDAAQRTGADYIGVGPLYATPTKPGRPAVGLELVRYAAGSASLPFFAIGGIDLPRTPAVLAAGARRIAVVRAVTEAGDPEAAARALRQAIAGRQGVEVGAT